MLVKSYLMLLDILLILTMPFTVYRLADPYLNTDAGTMSPFEHGEVFVLDDGGEVRNYRKLISSRGVLLCEPLRIPLVYCCCLVV